MTDDGEAGSGLAKRARTAVVTYGNGVLKALRAREAFLDRGVDVIDTPCLSRPPAALRARLAGYDSVLFADVCRDGAGPYAQWLPQLQRDGLLPAKWAAVGATNTYNPLGQTGTFLSDADVGEALGKLLLEE